MRNTKKLTQLALLTSMALIIFVIELKIPSLVPLPGVKLGLANIITVYAVYHYNVREVLALVLIRIILGSVFSGGMMALLYSLSGALLCLVGMIGIHKVLEERYIWVCSILGAILHNTGQMIVAVLVMQTWGICVYFPFLLLSGCLAGMCTGLCAQYLTKSIKKSFIPIEEKN